MYLPLKVCTLRSWRPEDVPALVRHADDRRVARWLRDLFPSPYTEEDARWWVGHAPSCTPETHFAIEHGGEAVGSIGLDLRRDVDRCGAEVGYWLGASAWGKGIATDALVGLTSWAWENLPLERLEALVMDGNDPSRRVLEKAGYALEGRLRKRIVKDGRVLDAFLYATVRR